MHMHSNMRSHSFQGTWQCNGSAQHARSPCRESGKGQRYAESHGGRRGLSQHTYLCSLLRHTASARLPTPALLVFRLSRFQSFVRVVFVHFSIGLCFRYAIVAPTGFYCSQMHGGIPCANNPPLDGEEVPRQSESKSSAGVGKWWPRKSAASG